jgi:TolB-like protein
MGRQVPVNQDRSKADFSRLIGELRQWQVFRVAAAYGVAAWLLVQVVATVGPAFDLPPWVLRAVVLAAIVGFLATMAFLLFRPRSAGKGRVAIYLSRRARLIAGAGVLVIAAAAAAYSVRALSAREHVSLAVLPFADLSPARDKAYFSEGVAEEILSSLAAEKDLKVLGRSSARQIERDADPKAVRASLGVTHLLEGSTRTDGDQLRVNVRLIDTKDGAQLWEEEYQGKLAEIFKVQDQIAGTVVRRLRGTFFGNAARATTPTQIGVYETYLAARALMRTRSTKTLADALELSKKVIAADPNYAPGHALYAELLFLLSDDPNSYGPIPAEKARALALPHARDAVRLAPDQAEGYAALGLILRGSAIRDLKRAIELDPGRTELRIWLGVALTELGRHDEAYAQYAAAAEAEPLWPVAINRRVQTLASSRKFEEALAAIRLFRARGGSEAQALRFLGTVASRRSDLSGSIAAQRAAHAKDPSVPYVQIDAAKTLALLGLHDQAVREWPSPADFGRLFVSGDRSQMLRWLEQNRAKVWNEREYESALFTLGTSRDWNSLALLYRTRPARMADFCNAETHSVPLMVLALRASGNAPEAQRLLGCATKRLDFEMRQKFSSPNAEPGRLEFRRASLLGVQEDRRGIEWLEKAVQRGWLGQDYSARLADWPQFDGFRSDPRYAALQKRIDATIARERAETLAGR